MHHPPPRPLCVEVGSWYTGEENNERLHLELEYSRVAVPYIVLPCANKLLFLNAQWFPSFQNEDMRIVALVATKVTHGPALIRLG